MSKANCVFANFSRHNKHRVLYKLSNAYRSTNRSVKKFPCTGRRRRERASVWAPAPPWETRTRRSSRRSWSRWLSALGHPGTWAVHPERRSPTPCEVSSREWCWARWRRRTMAGPWWSIGWAWGRPRASRGDIRNFSVGRRDRKKSWIFFEKKTLFWTFGFFSDAFEAFLGIFCEFT